ncbi:MAG: SDR family oxidoreductase [Planctomycetia bacterium]|nr:SDR family oxidoreductase [Planctomycetia bacterium]
MKRIAGKLALVTGAASGIGRAIALALAHEGANLFLVDINQPRLAETADEARRRGVHVDARVCDVSRPEEVHQTVEALLETWGGLDILVNNAGIAFYGPTVQMTEEQWERLLAVNLHAPIQFTRELLPALLARPEAHILNVCSIAGLVATPRLAAYHVSKFALVGFSEALRVEYGCRGLGVTALCPGLVRTSIFQSAATAPGKSVPRFPGWMFTSPERVAARAIRAIRRAEGLVVVTPMAHLLWGVKRFTPGLLDWIHRFRFRRRRTEAAAPLVLRTLRCDNSSSADLAYWDDSSEENPATIPFETGSPVWSRRAA